MSVTLDWKVRERRLAQMKRALEAQIAAGSAFGSNAAVKANPRLARLHTLRQQVDRKLTQLRGVRANAVD